MEQMKHYGTQKEGEQMQEQNTQELEQAEKVTPSAIYQNNIYAIIDDVKSEPLYEGLTDRELKQDKSFFTALVHRIYNEYIGDLLGNKDNTIKVTYPDISVLDNLFNIYIDLVVRYKWNNRPTILEFSILTGINRDTYYQWLKGDYENNISVDDKRKHITSKYTHTVQKWNNICESALVDGSGDTIKELFLLKSKYGYREADKDINITVEHKNIISADDLPALIDLENVVK